MKPGPIMAWSTANIGYHHIHHLNPRIPFYRLPEAVAAIPESQHPRTTSLPPRAAFRSPPSQVSDVEAHPMRSPGNPPTPTLLSPPLPPTPPNTSTPTHC